MFALCRAPRHLSWLALCIAVLAGCTTSFDVTTLPHADASLGDTGGMDARDVTPPLDQGVVDTGNDTGVDAFDARPEADVPDARPEGGADGACGPCGTDEMCCGGACVNITRDFDHCGDCETACPGTVCLSATCTGTCRGTNLNCDGNVVNGCEVDAATDNANCGACGRTCPTGRTCVAGVCECASGTADCDGNPANGCEVALATDVQHCGMCTMQCSTGQSCVAGACVCATGFANCDLDPMNGCEVNTATDAQHCGACGTVCGVNSTCVDGACQCDPAFQRCATGDGGAGGCTTPINDPNHCGRCDLACTDPTPVCSVTMMVTGCTSGCATGQTRCGSSCVDTTSDVNNCGACGAACTAPTNSAARCNASVCGFACNSGFADCDANPVTGCETNVQTDASNCGGCGVHCGAGQSCVLGACACPTGQRQCADGSCAACCTNSDCNDGNGCTTDVCTGGACMHNGCSGSTSMCCGGLACHACCNDADCGGAPLNRGCGTDGTCSTCAAGFADCNAMAADGCESNLSTSVNNCGACGMVCTFANATATCSAGTCRLGTCAAGFADCDGNAANGCETNLGSSNANCGRCGLACTAVGTTCQSGTCQVNTCPAGRGDCDHLSSNGCEADLTSDPSNCGGCGTACSFPNAAATCVSSACALGACANGFANCNGMAVDGCEVNTTSNAANCGTCGNRCTLANATAVCAASACAVGMCNSGFADCNRAPGDGCETNTAVDVNNCGGCGTACPTPPHATVNCNAGTCGFTCLPNFADCNGVAADGCEVDLTNDPAHCGVCSTTCAANTNASAVCLGGSCGLSCGASFANCDGNLGNGCETNVGGDINNCGGCGVVCPQRANSTTACVAGQCRYNCTGPFADCDRAAADGCEANTNTSAAACGACGTSCGATASTPDCSGGTCGASCASGTNCSGSCVNTNSDRNNCGSCGHACNNTQQCSSGLCLSATCLNGGQTSCFGACVTTASDRNNCGACGNVCEANQACINGSCQFRGDECYNPFVLPLASGEVVLNGLTAGGTATSTGSSCDSSAPDVYFSFHLSQREYVYVDTFGSTVPTQLGITSSCFRSPTCNDNACSTGQSQLAQLLDAGTYLIVVDFQSLTASSTFNLRVQHIPVAGTSSGTLMSGTQMLGGNTTGATNSPSTCGAGSDRWYSWLTCPGDAAGNFTASSCGGASFDTVLQLRNGDGTGACNDNSLTCAPQSSLSARASGGAGLHVFYVDSASTSASGTYNVTVNRP